MLIAVPDTFQVKNVFRWFLAKKKKKKKKKKCCVHQKVGTAFIWIEAPSRIEAPPLFLKEIN